MTTYAEKSILALLNYFFVLFLALCCFKTNKSSIWDNIRFWGIWLEIKCDWSKSYQFYKYFRVVDSCWHKFLTSWKMQYKLLLVTCNKKQFSYWIFFTSLMLLWNLSIKWWLQDQAGRRQTHSVSRAENVVNFSSPQESISFIRFEYHNYTALLLNLNPSVSLSLCLSSQSVRVSVETDGWKTCTGGEIFWRRTASW